MTHPAECGRDGGLAAAPTRESLRLGPGCLHQKWYITADGRVHRHVLPHRCRQRAGTRLAAEMPAEERRIIGEDLKVVQYRWPLGMPLVRKMGPDLWELRSSIPDGIARVFFSIWNDCIVALNGFVKKSQKTPDNELDMANRRLANFKRNTK